MPLRALLFLALVSVASAAKLAPSGRVAAFSALLTTDRLIIEVEEVDCYSGRALRRRLEFFADGFGSFGAGQLLSGKTFTAPIQDDRRLGTVFLARGEKEKLDAYIQALRGPDTLAFLSGSSSISIIQMRGSIILARESFPEIRSKAITAAMLTFGQMLEALRAAAQ